MLKMSKLCKKSKVVRGGGTTNILFYSSGWCFGPNSYVETRLGMKLISGLQIGDQIKTAFQGGQTDFTEVGYYKPGLRWSFTKLMFRQN